MAGVQPKTFLELARTLRQEGRGPGAAGTPTDTEGQTGDSKDYCDWIAESWIRIQMEKQGWRWMFADVEIPVTSAAQDYSLATIFPTATDLERFDHWKPHAFQYTVTSEGLVGQRPLRQRLWEDHIGGDYGSIPAVTRPSGVIVMPDNSLRLREPVTEDGTLLARYYKSPQQLVTKEDVPEFPPQFHMLIVWDAMLEHAVGEVAQEQYTRATNRRTELWYQLLNRQLEPVVNYATTMVR